MSAPSPPGSVADLARPSAAGLTGACVLQVIPALETGGAERTTLEVARALVAAGARSVVASEGGGLVPRLEAEGSCHVRLPVASKNPFQMLRNRRLLRRLARDCGAGLIHARSRAPAWPALWAARDLGLPLVTTYHGAYGARGRAKAYYNSVMARGDVVIANSRFTAEAIRAAYAGWSFMDEARLVTIPRGADLSAFDPAALTEERRAAARAALGGRDGGGGGGFDVLLPGRLTSWKGQRVLIDAARLLRDRGQASGLTVALVGGAQGRDGYEGELRGMIEAHGLTDIVHLRGHWDDMPAAYDWADVVVSASTRPEAFGRVAVEAMAMGRPVIASAHGGALETIAEGETGILVPPGDAGALADALAGLATDPDRRARLGAAGRARARGRFSVEAMTSATLSVYKGLLDGEGRTHPPQGDAR